MLLAEIKAEPMSTPLTETPKPVLPYDGPEITELVDGFSQTEPTDKKVIKQSKQINLRPENDVREYVMKFSNKSTQSNSEIKDVYSIDPTAEQTFNAFHNYGLDHLNKGPYIEQASEYFSSIWTPEEVEAMTINNLSHTRIEAEINVIRLKKKQQTMIKSIEDLMDDITSGE